MPLFRRPLLLLLVAALTGGTVSAAMADGREGDGQKKQQSSRDDDEDSLSDAVRRVERATQGQILSAERVQFDGRDIHRVKVVDDRGRVRIYVDDPEKPEQASDDKPPPGSNIPRTRRDDNDDPNL